MARFTVGLTGGIGSGKTAVSDCFARLGVTIVDADVASRVVVAPGRPALQKIEEHFGPQLIDVRGELKRAELRKIIFANKQEKQWLEALLHPLIYAEIVSELRSAISAYAILVSPLLLESGQNRLADRVLVVDVLVEEQLNRTVARDNNSPQQVQSIIESQMPRDQRLSLADDVIENTGTLEDLTDLVRELHERYLLLADDKN